VKLMKKEGIAITDLKADYPTGDQAMVSTIMCQRAHESAEQGKVLDLVY
jgi:hypothetical protein